MATSMVSKSCNPSQHNRRPKGGQLMGNIEVEAETTDQPSLKAVPDLADEEQVGSESV